MKREVIKFETERKAEFHFLLKFERVELYEKLRVVMPASQPAGLSACSLSCIIVRQEWVIRFLGYSLLPSLSITVHGTVTERGTRFFLREDLT